MLRRAREDELDVLITEFWPEALDLRRSSYPTYTDGIKTREDFSEQVYRAARESWGEVLVHLWQGEINGLLVVDTVDDEFVSLPICLTHQYQRECLNEGLTHLRCKHDGKRLWLGFAPENAEMLAFVEQNGFVLLDDAVNWNMQLSCWLPRVPELSVHRVNDDNYDSFRDLWRDENMYWNAERIRTAMDQWLLFVTENGATACKDDGSTLEIFGFQYRDSYDETAHRALMTACLNAAKQRSAEYLTYFSEREEEHVMQSLGFRRVSDYRCYEIKLQ